MSRADLADCHNVYHEQAGLMGLRVNPDGPEG
jgi:hypothetical protein